MYDIQQCFICRPSDSTVSEDAEIEPGTVATTALTVRRSNHSASLFLNVAYRKRLVTRLYFWKQWFKRTVAWVVFLLTMHPVKFKNCKNGNSKVCWLLANHLKMGQYFMVFRLEPYSPNFCNSWHSKFFFRQSIFSNSSRAVTFNWIRWGKVNPKQSVVGRGHTSKFAAIFDCAWNVLRREF